MRCCRIYQPGVYHVGESIALDPEPSRHVSLVLRMQIGDALVLFSGDNQEFSATIESIEKRIVHVRIHSVSFGSSESPVKIHLVQGLSKDTAMEWIVQKAVELGVSSITPIITQHCAVKIHKESLIKKRAQWTRIAIGAAEQCGRSVVPLIHPIERLTDYVNNHPTHAMITLCPTGQESWRSVTKCEKPYSILVGPEGGFSLEEEAFLLNHQALRLQLGPRILRTETAAIAALCLIQAMVGDI